MTKGVRAFAIQQFNRYLPQLNKLGGTEFRRKIMDAIQEQFGSSLGSAATNYNYAFQLAREAKPDAVIGLGRNPITAASAGAKPRKVGRGGQSQARNAAGNLVTVARETSGVVIAEAIPRAKARNMVASSGGRGRPRLVIVEDQE